MKRPNLGANENTGYLSCGLEVRRVKTQAAVIIALARALCLTVLMEKKGREMLMNLNQSECGRAISDPVSQSGLTCQY